MRLQRAFDPVHSSPPRIPLLHRVGARESPDVWLPSHPVNRERMFLSGLLSESVKRVRAMEDLVKVYARKVVATLDMYFVAGKNEIQALIDARRQNKERLKPLARVSRTPTLCWRQKR